MVGNDKVSLKRSFLVEMEAFKTCEKENGYMWMVAAMSGS